jgi:hypothetical protein
MNQQPDEIQSIEPEAVVEKKTSGLALASMITSFFFCTVVAGLVAAVLGIVALVQIGKNPSLKGKGMAITGIVVGLVGVFVLIPVLIPALGAARRAAHRLEDGQNVRKLQMLLISHPTMHQGDTAPDLGTALVQSNLLQPPDMILSPFGDQTRTVPSNYFSLTEDQQRDWINQNSDYIYVRPLEPGNYSPYQILVYTHPDIAKEIDGMNVGFEDGHLEWRADWETIVEIHRDFNGDEKAYNEAKGLSP